MAGSGVYVQRGFRFAMSHRARCLIAFATLVALPLIAGQRVAAPERPPGPPGTASIAGVVLRSGSNEPAPGIHVSISANNASVVAPHAPVDSDANGKFAFTTLDAGTYRLSFDGEGYVRQQYGQRLLYGEGSGTNASQAIVVAAGQAVKGITVLLTPTAILSGSVHDSTGRPLATVRVQLVRAEYNNYGEKSLQSVALGRSDDRGLYRISGITPGRYFLMAGGNAETSANPNELPETTALAFYPGVAELGSATTIEILPAAEKSGMNFILRTQLLHRIRGHAIDEEHGSKLERLTVTYRRPSLLSGGGETIGQSDAATGEFEIRDLAPGTYSVRVQTLFQGEGRGARFVSHSAVKDITVGDSDTDNVVFTTRAASSIRGKFLYEGAGPTSPVRASLALRPVLPGGAPTSDMPDGSGNFEIQDVTEGDYRVAANGIAPPYYVKSVGYGGVEMLGSSFHYQEGDDRRMDVTIASGLAQLSGNVVDDRLQPVPVFAAVLIPNQRERTDLYKTARVNGATGHFTIPNVPPGSYKVFVWDVIDPYSYFDPEVMKKYESTGRAVEVTAATDMALELKVTVNTNHDQ